MNDGETSKDKSPIYPDADRQTTKMQGRLTIANIETIKIHPSIGIARLGNSPTEFFIGPENPGSHPRPRGGYRDAQGRIKRQAARFRLFGYDENGKLLREITAKDATITWTVSLANKKAEWIKFQGPKSATDQDLSRTWFSSGTGWVLSSRRAENTLRQNGIRHADVAVLGGGQSIHPDVSIPYWDWTKASEESVPQWLHGFTPTVPMHQPTPPISVLRQPGTQQDLATIASNIPAVMQRTDFVNFWSQLEGVHNGVHVWVGGSMGSIPTAPADPLFWMHHANIDRLWWQWQTSPPGQGKNPNRSGVAAVMDPWPYTEADTRDITTLGYTYA